MHAHIDAPRTGEIVGHTVLSYLESRARSPPDVLLIGNDDRVSPVRFNYNIMVVLLQGQGPYLHVALGRPCRS